MRASSYEVVKQILPGALCIGIVVLIGTLFFQVALVRGCTTKPKCKQEQPVFTAMQAVDVCAGLVPQEYPDPTKVTLVRKPTVRLVDDTWLVVGLADAPVEESGVLYRKEWACGVSQNGKTIQFVTVRGD